MGHGRSVESMVGGRRAAAPRVDALRAGGRLRGVVTTGYPSPCAPSCWTPRVSGVQAILLMWFAGGVPLAERVPNGDHTRLATSSADVTFSVTAASICAALAVVVLCLRLRSVILEPDGLVIRRLRRHRRIRWEELAPGGPPPPAKPGGRITFRLRYPQPGVVPPDREDVMTSYLDVDPGFLAAVVRHYVDQPDHRHAIGTPDELTRLRTALLGAGVS